MESAPNKGTVDVGYKEGKIGDNVYVYAGNTTMKILIYKTWQHQ